MTADPKVAKELLNQVDEQCAKMLKDKVDEVHVAEGNALGEQLRAPLEKSLKELDTLLKKSFPDWKDTCGLVLETARDGTSEWVLPEHVEEFKAKGAALFEKAASS